VGAQQCCEGMSLSTHQQWADVLRAVNRPGADAHPEALLRQAVELGHDVAPDSVGCSVTTIDGDQYHTPVFSDGLALDLDRAQYQAGDGPCMFAARTKQQEHFDARTDGERYPGFAEAAVARGVGSSISLPLPNRHLAAAINIYATSPHAFNTERPRAVAALLARCVSALMSPPDLAAQPDGEPVPAAKVEAAQARARLVTDAESFLMSSRSLSRSDALALLIRRSRAEGRSIFEIAREIAGDGAAWATGAAR
jgi:hypothetical protein